MLDHSSYIGVRGMCTGEYLKSLGFKSVEVIGCPSMFMNGPVLTAPTPIEKFDRSTRLSVNISAAGKQAVFSTGLDKMGQVIARAVYSYDDVEYVPQQRDSLMALVLGTRPTSNVASAIGIDRCTTPAGSRPSSIRTWIEHLARRDFVRHQAPR